MSRVEAARILSEHGFSAEEIDKLYLLRKKALRAQLGQHITTGVTVVLVFMVILPFLQDVINQSWMWLIITLVMASILLVWVFKRRADKYAKEYGMSVKNVVVTKVLKEKFDNVVYNPGEGVDFAKLSFVGFRTEEYNNSDDLFNGKYKDVKFSQADIHTEKIVRRGKTSSRETVFRGRWLDFEFNKEFKKYLQVKSLPLKEGSIFTTVFGKQNSSRGSTKIMMENPEFNKKFSCFTTDDHTTFYLLTPHMLEKILDLRKKYDRFDMFFLDNHLYMAIETPYNAYEIDTQEVSASYIWRIQKEMELITEVIDTLDIDVDIFKD